MANGKGIKPPSSPVTLPHPPPHNAPPHAAHPTMQVVQERLSRPTPPPTHARRWDYGYQTTAMANRTVIVDNNTWNNTHIATVGRAMCSSEAKVRSAQGACCGVRDLGGLGMGAQQCARLRGACPVPTSLPQPVAPAWRRVRFGAALTCHRAQRPHWLQGWKIYRSLDVNYVVVVFGGLVGYPSDDINKFLWMVGGVVVPACVCVHVCCMRVRMCKCGRQCKHPLLFQVVRDLMTP